MSLLNDPEEIVEKLHVGLRNLSATSNLYYARKNLKEHVQQYSDTTLQQVSKLLLVETDANVDGARVLFGIIGCVRAQRNQVFSSTCPRSIKLSGNRETIAVRGVCIHELSSLSTLPKPLPPGRRRESKEMAAAIFRGADKFECRQKREVGGIWRPCHTHAGNIGEAQRTETLLLNPRPWMPREICSTTSVLPIPAFHHCEPLCVACTLYRVECRNG